MPDRHFDPASTLVEDRVVLFQSKGFDDALRQGEDEARGYAKLTMSNIYWQRVRLKFLGVIDAYLIGETEPDAGHEVYSSTVVVTTSVKDSELVHQRRGPKRGNHWRARMKFADAAIMAEGRKGPQR